MGELLGATNQQLEARVKSLETWRVAVAIDAYKSATKAILDALTARIVALEKATGGTTDLGPLTAQVTALAAAVAKLQTTVCPQQSVLDNHEARLDVLDNDHLPTP